MRRYIALLFVLLLVLTGCRTQMDPIPTETATEPPATAQATEAPPATEAPRVEMEDAESLYWKMKNAVGGRKMYQYTSSEELRIQSGSAVTETTVVNRISQNSPPVAIHVETETTMVSQSGEGSWEMTQTIETYVQVEDGKPVVYYYSESDDLWLRYVDNVAPSEYLKLYALNGIPYGIPEVMSLDPETKMIGDREAYVLRCRLTTAESLGAYLEGVEVDTVYYVDVETYIPFQIRREYLGMDVLMSDSIRAMMESMGIPAEQNLKFDSFEYREVIDRISFDPVQVDAVPEEGIQNSVDITGDYSDL